MRWGESDTHERLTTASKRLHIARRTECRGESKRHCQVSGLAARILARTPFIYLPEPEPEPERTQIYGW